MTLVAGDDDTVDLLGERCRCCRMPMASSRWSRARRSACPGGSATSCPTPPHGLFVLDTRVLSRWELRVDGHPLEPLTVTLEAPFEATFVCRSAPSAGRADADLVVLRHRSIGSGMRERVVAPQLRAGPAPGGRGAALRR